MSIDPTAEIHPQAIVEPGAVIGPGCTVGPFSLIGPEVTLGARVTVKSHVVITGHTRIGDETVVFPFTTLGEIPQDKKFAGERTRLVIGARNRIRECVTMNTGTEGGGGLTSVGDDCLFMACTHVAHDCQIGNRVIMVNGSGLAGHVVLEDDVIVGGISGIHQFVRVGRGAIIGGLTKVVADVIPFALVHGPDGEIGGLNLVGLRRRGVDKADIAALRDVYEALREGNFRESARRLADAGTGSAMADEVLDFILGPSSRSFLTPQ
jgi:UDP-N-acetylglucosamine acyltransferase